MLAYCANVCANYATEPLALISTRGGAAFGTRSSSLWVLPHHNAESQPRRYIDANFSAASGDSCSTYTM